MIIYPAFFFLPGIFALFAAFSGSRFTWLFLLLPVILLPAVLGRLRLIVITSSGLLVARLILGDINASAVILQVVGTALVTVAYAVRCPRCAGPVATRNPLWNGGPSYDWCPICGRRRQGIWPFQYTFRPEAWDGDYHDEGGGPSSVDSTMDWQRDLMFRRWRKFHRHDHSN
jgi:hypothetical protein